LAGDVPVPMSASSYVVLGLVEQCGTATPYDLKRMVDVSIGYFWDFPQSQLYAEAARLVSLGLLVEEQEPSGRRRRLLSVTEAGLDALRSWVAEPTLSTSQVRDLGLLKLFFADVVDRRTLVRLAEQQRDAHLQRLSEYEALDVSGPPPNSTQHRTLEMGLTFEHACVAFWESVMTEPPRQRTARRRSPKGG
jgi:PadR family transcriptional regulator AphA